MTEEFSAGNFIWDWILKNNINKENLANKLNISFTVLNRIIYNQTRITADMALLFEEHLKINSRDLLIKQMDYELQIALANKAIKFTKPI